METILTIPSKKWCYFWKIKTYLPQLYESHVLQTNEKILINLFHLFNGHYPYPAGEKILTNHKLISGINVINIKATSKIIKKGNAAV